MVAACYVVATLSLSRTFEGFSYMAWALPAIAAGAAFALTYGRRSLGLSFLGLLVVEFFTLPALFARELTAALLPTPAAWRLVWTLMGSGFSGVLQETAPVTPEPRFMVVIWTAALALGFLGAAWIVVERPVGAVVTAVAVTAFAGTVGEGGGQAGFAVAVVACAGGFFLLDGRRRIEAWSARATRVPAWVGVPTLAAACLLALVSPPVIGSTEPLLDLKGALRSRLVIIKPLSDIKRQLEVNPPIEVMRVTAPRSEYWRLTGLQSYTGTEWVLEARPEDGSNGPVEPPDPPTFGEVLPQEYRIVSLLSPWLPAAFAADSVDTPVPFEFDTGSSTLLLKGKTIPGLRYSVTSRLPSAVFDNSAGGRLARPDETGLRYADLALGIGRGTTTPFQLASSLERHFRRYTYDENVEGGHTIERIDRFLAERRGYCEQFAAAMTLMLRGVGIPARVAVGFLPGRHLGGGEYLVTTKEAHAWVEADIPGMGWTRFDPTPTRGEPLTGRQQEEQVPTAPPLAAASPPPVSPLPPTPLPSPGRQTQADPWPLAGAALLLLGVGAIPGAKRIRREMRRGRTVPHEIAVGAYEELVDRATDLGFTHHRADTPWDFHGRAFRRTDKPARDAAGDLVGRTVLALYGREQMSQREAKLAWERLGPALSGLRRTVPWWRRVMATFSPRTLLPPEGLLVVVRRRFRRVATAGVKPA
jgi:transglutaminase-like putative cysteine protease